MGDLIEFTTWPKPHNVFYKITSSALTIEIKAAGNAAIGLSREPSNNCDFWILIGENQRCCIKSKASQVSFHCTSAHTPGILSADEYRTFWLKWCNGQLSFGHEGRSEPIVSCPNKSHGLKYVTFSVVEARNPVHWRFEIPPVTEKKKCREVTESELHWVPYKQGQDFLEEPLVGGFEEENLFIARAMHRGSLTPGKLIPSTGLAYISWNGLANEKSTDFEVLCGCDCFWVPSSEDNIPVGAFIAGYSENGAERLYIGRAEHAGHLIPGKIHPSYKKLLFSYKQREVGANKFEILVLPEKNIRCVGKIIHLHSPLYARSQNDLVDSENSNDSDEVLARQWRDQAEEWLEV